jgi:hypothetical protein
MTDEKFEKILQQALTPEVTDGDIQIYKRAKKRTWKKIVKIGIAAACAALIVTTSAGGIFSGNTVTLDNLAKETAQKNPFVMTCFATEMKEGESVQVPATISGKSADGYAVCEGEDFETVSYAIGAEFICEGEGISSVTYSINEGAFGVTQLKDDRLITDYVEYSGPKLSCPDLGFADEGQDSSESKYEKLFVSEYTVSYNRQSLDTSIVGIYGEKTDESIYQSVFWDGFEYGTDQEQDARGFTSLMDGVEITCTVNYADGTTDSRVIVIRGCVQEENGVTRPDFAYELK